LGNAAWYVNHVSLGVEVPITGSLDRSGALGPKNSTIELVKLGIGEPLSLAKKNDAENVMPAGRLTAAPEEQSGTTNVTYLLVAVVTIRTAREWPPRSKRLVLTLML
jgi:hypothetical protein